MTFHAPETSAEPPPPARSTRRGWRRLVTWRRIVALLIAVLVVEFLVIPQLVGASKSLALLRQIHLGYLALGIALEAAALVAYAQLTRTLLPHGGRLTLRTILRVNLSTLGLSHVVPGGTVGGAALNYRLFTGLGVPGADVGFALAVQGIGSAVVLNVLLWLGLVISIPIRGFDPLYVTAAIIGSMLIGGFFALIFFLTRGEARAAKVLRAVARRLPFLDEEAAHRAVHRVADQLRFLMSDRNMLARAVGWSAANWLLDAASLGVFLAAFGHRISPDGLLVAFCLANVLAAIPVTPGGLGVVEAVLTPTLAGFGAPGDVALLAVIAYRFFNFWLPIPVGAVAYASLKAGQPTLKDCAEEILREKELARQTRADDSRAPRPQSSARAEGTAR